MTEIVVEKNNRNASWLRRALVWVCSLFLVVLGGVLFLHWAKQKSIGTVSVPQQASSTTTVKEQPKKKYEGKYFTFSYSGQYKESHAKVDAKFPLIEQELLKEPSFEGKKIAVVVQDNAGNSLDDFSSYRIRNDNPAIYTSKDTVVQGHHATLFIKNTPVYEVGVFWSFDQKVASIIITSQTKMGDIQEEVEEILQSLQFSR